MLTRQALRCRDQDHVSRDTGRRGWRFDHGMQLSGAP
jgi:hypothetical protein